MNGPLGLSKVLLVLVLCQAGCQGPPPVATQRETAVPSYDELIERYNDNIAPIGNLRASGMTVVYAWHDDSGDHKVQGEGRLAIVFPDRLMFRVTHISRSVPILWAGSDGQRYWLFDFRDERKAYYGHFANNLRGRPNRSALPIDLRHFPQLLGLMPLDAVLSGPRPEVIRDQDGYMIEPPGLGARLWVSPATYHAVRIELLDPERQLIVSAKLTQPERLAIRGTPPGAWPYLASRIEITRPGQDKLRLRLPWDELWAKDVNPVWFNFEKLVKLYKIPEHHQINLNFTNSSPARHAKPAS